MLSNFARQGSIVAALLLVTASVAFAAKPSPPSTSSISLAPMGAATTTGPSYGQAVTFNVSTTATTQPFVHLRCSQGGTLVYESWQAWFYGKYGVQSFTLGGTTAWQGGGAADCTAYLENWDGYGVNGGKISLLASTTFHVNA
jgi:hypothetical protein